ncbi:MAG TPA: hypothetical protein VK859_15310, partial [bacterium]|nr:hypothetical protein [bacterium]
LMELGWIKSRQQIVTRVDLDLPGAYVIYDENRDQTVSDLISFYRKNRVVCVGRYGRWEYGSMESAMEQGIGTAKEILSGKPF